MKQSGVTLIELMVVAEHRLPSCWVFGIPLCRPDSHKPLVQLNQNELISSLHLARSEAIKRMRARCCARRRTASSCEASGGWHQGWLVFHDINNQCRSGEENR